MLVGISGCAVNTIVEQKNGVVLAAVRDANYQIARNKAIESANQYCSTRGGGGEYLRHERPYDNMGAAYYLYFRCYDLKEKQERDRKIAEEKKAEQAKKEKLKKDKKDAKRIAVENAQKKWELEQEAKAQKLRDYLNKNNIQAVTSRDVVVNYRALSGKRVYLECDLSGAGRFSVDCNYRSNFRVSLIEKSMDRTLYSFALSRCSDLFQNTLGWCGRVKIVGTVDGSSPGVLNGAFAIDP